MATTSKRPMPKKRRTRYSAGYRAAAKELGIHTTQLYQYSCKVVGYALADHMRAELVCDALKAALGRRGTPSGVLVHTDRGTQYCSHEYQNLLHQHGLIPSMSRRGNCWDHATTESFFHSLKIEAIRDETLRTHRQLRHHRFQYIEVDYNRARRHSTIGYLSPEVFEAKNVA